MFWKKNRFDLNVGDSVKIIDGVKFLDLNIDISDWQGRIIEIGKRSIELELDSLTLENFNKVLFDHYKEEDDYPHIITVPKKDIELSEPRDTLQEVESAQDKIIDKLDKGSGEIPYRLLIRKWLRHFLRSENFQELSNTDKDNTEFIVEVFADYMHDYEGKIPKKWTLNSIKEVCLNWVPNKISAKKELFESFGKVLIVFFLFLEERKYLKTKVFQELIVEIQGEIIENSEKPSNWGMAKSFMMKAMGSGVDLNDKDEMDNFLMGEQLRSLSEFNRVTGGLDSKNVDKKQFKGIWKNSKVTVKYTDGRIIEEVKFKDVEDDLLRGMCELIKK